MTPGAPPYAERYAELAAMSCYSFLEGASHPRELIDRAFELGIAAIAIADVNTFAGVVQAHGRIREVMAALRGQGQNPHALSLIIGTRIVLNDGAAFICLPQDRVAYGRLSRLITLGRRRAPKGACDLSLDDLAAHAAGSVIIAIPPAEEGIEALERFYPLLLRARESFGEALWLGASHHYGGANDLRIARLDQLARKAGIRLTALGDVRFHHESRKPLHDVLTSIREKTTLETAGFRLSPNAERTLKSPAEMARLFRAFPDAIAATMAIAARCRFDLSSLRYEYPEEIITPGLTADEDLSRRTWAGAHERYGELIPPMVDQQLRRELFFIAKKEYAPFFLTVHEIVLFARSRGILCQGRGSAANSAVCFVLGITSVDPADGNCLFERFISDARNEPPDIDVDFEHERREEVIQHIYARYGRERAGLAATVIHYRWRRAIREAGKVMGLSEDVTASLARASWGWHADDVADGQLKELGLDPRAPKLARALDMARQLTGLPRHLSQHVGGFVISRGLLSELVPIENAAMADRTVIEWDKDDIETLGLLKVDVLALGMLTCIRKAFDLIAQHGGPTLDLAAVPREDPAVYDMICDADTVGVFQIESRAQMSMLPRLKPRCFYDLVIEVAIVRPGPIQGDMVHPYLRRREGKETVNYPSEALREVLEKTLGVPLFQEQAMRIAIVGAGFSPAEADQLRRAMATFKKSGDIQRFRERFIGGMMANSYQQEFAERCFRQIEGFGTYGFPESHAASFARLVYVSAWLKRHHPAAFAAALLNSQPMGFYAPAQIIGDARRHGVSVRPIDVNASRWDNTLEEGAGDALALRLGFREIKGMREEAGQRIVEARTTPFATMTELGRRAALDRATLMKLAGADALASLGLDRRQALWAAGGFRDHVLPLFAAADARENTSRAERMEADPALRPMHPGSAVTEDYRALGYSLKAHPFSFLRPRLSAEGHVSSRDLPLLGNDSWVKIAGLVLVRQRPGTAKGTLFITLEDEFGSANIIVWPHLFEPNRRTILAARLMRIEGRLQREGKVIHVIARRLADITALARTLDVDAAEALSGLARADEVARPAQDQRNKEIAQAMEFLVARETELRIRSRDFH